MKIAVLAKQVPDSDDVKMNRETGTMIRDGTGNIINPLDLNALEVALSVKSERGGSVTVISMGPPQADLALREALALGADSAVLVSDRLFAGSDSLATATVLSRTIEKLGGFDLILAGEKATDGETGQVGPEAAALLGIPFATYVSKIDTCEESVTIERTVEDGFERQRMRFPCLITVLNDINEPSMPTLSGKKRARRADVRIIEAADLGLTKEETGLAGSPTRVVRISSPKISRETEFFCGPDLDRGIERTAELIRELALI
jgi:electron transfer flavoprotein beta subunit